MANASTITVKDAAKQAGMTTEGIRYHAREGAFRISRGRIDSAAFAAWVDKRDEVDDGSVYKATARERLRKLRAERRTAEMAADEQAGRLLQADRVAAVWEAANKGLRDQLLALHSTLQGQFPDMRLEIAEAIKSRVRQILQDAADRSKA